MFFKSHMYVMMKSYVCHAVCHMYVMLYVTPSALFLVSPSSLYSLSSPLSLSLTLSLSLSLSLSSLYISSPPFISTPSLLLYPHLPPLTLSSSFLPLTYPPFPLSSLPFFLASSPLHPGCLTSSLSSCLRYSDPVL